LSSGYAAAECSENADLQERIKVGSMERGASGYPTVAVVVLAGGSGLRIRHDRNKAYLPLGDRTAVGLSLQTMATAAGPGLRRLLLVVRADDQDLAQRTVAAELQRPPVPVELVVGGGSRHGSEERALHRLEPAIRAGDLDLVLIHDAARPLCSPRLVGELVRTANAHGGAVPGLAADDLAAVDASGALVPLAGRHVRVQTPQVFAAAPLLEAYLRAAGSGFEGTDTAACVERFSPLTVMHVDGEEQNFKITYPHDLQVAADVVRRRLP
jgi:2-C-methyl-D-erythritol 4-phosphate cytidylyltransferase